MNRDCDQGRQDEMWGETVDWFRSAAFKTHSPLLFFHGIKTLFLDCRPSMLGDSQLPFLPALFLRDFGLLEGKFHQMADICCLLNMIAREILAAAVVTSFFWDKWD